MKDSIIDEYIETWDEKNSLGATTDHESNKIMIETDKDTYIFDHDEYRSNIDILHEHKDHYLCDLDEELSSILDEIVGIMKLYCFNERLFEYLILEIDDIFATDIVKPYTVGFYVKNIIIGRQGKYEKVLSHDKKNLPKNVYQYKKEKMKTLYKNKKGRGNLVFVCESDDVIFDGAIFNLLKSSGEELQVVFFDKNGYIKGAEKMSVEKFFKIRSNNNWLENMLILGFIFIFIIAMIYIYKFW